ncbi:hypothetical protein ABM90_14210 [Rhodococcus erythropolis]|nr:hypothetical protein ABM90_14210 [Rhodococcus erythropolis]
MIGFCWQAAPSQIKNSTENIPELRTQGRSSNQMFSSNVHSSICRTGDESPWSALGVPRPAADTPGCKPFHLNLDSTLKIISRVEDASVGPRVANQITPVAPVAQCAWRAVHVLGSLARGEHRFRHGFSLL